MATAHRDPEAPSSNGPDPRVATAQHGSVSIVEPFAKADSDTDRRVVTVLFADLSGFTALSARLDAEVVRALQSELFLELSSAVDRYGGFVEKYVGDAVMAAFGAPAAHEDDCERALRAALAMHEGVRALAARWEERVGSRLALHIGVNTGPVVAGNLGDTPRAAYAVTGDTVNVASRLLAAADAGETLVSAATYRLTEHAFAFEVLPDLVVKGKAEPVPAYRLSAALDAPRSARGLEGHGLVAPMIGRDEDLSQLVAAFDRMLGGHAQIVSVVGEAGAGKSRLVREFLETLSASGRLATATVRTAACSSLGERAYGTLAAFLREGYALHADDGREAVDQKVAATLESLGSTRDEIAAIAPVLGYVLGFPVDGRQPSDVEPEQLKRRIVLAMRLLVERRLEHGPVLLVVEDIQWSDAASVELLRVLLDRLLTRRLMLVVTHRPTFDAAALVGGRAPHIGLRLTPLSGEHTEALLRAFLGPSLDGWPGALRDLVVTRAGGNPFYLEEILRGLISAGVLTRGESGWRCGDDVAGVDVPPTIQALLVSRVDRLTPFARRVLQEAAVLGHVFESRLLRLVTTEPARCESALELLVDADLLEEVMDARAPGGRFRFSHTLVQEIVYGTLLRRRRAELHGHAAREMERLCGASLDRLDDLEALGRHLCASGEHVRGARYLLAAGDRARAIYANEDALRYYRRALEACGDGEEARHDQTVLRERLGDLSALTGERVAAFEQYEAVLVVLTEAADRPGQARLHRKLGGLHWSAGERERAQACCHRGLALLEGDDQQVELAHLCAELGRMAFRSGDNQGALMWAERALRQARVIGSSLPGAADDEVRKDIAASVAHAHNTLGITLARMGRTRDAVACIEQSVQVAEPEGLLTAACRSWANLGVLYSSLDPARAIVSCERGLELARKIGDMGLQSRLYANLAISLCTLTNRCEEKGIEAARTAVELDRRLGLLDHLAVPLIVLAQIYQCHGQPRLALARFHEALELAEQMRDPQLLFPCYDGLAALHLEMGDDARGEEYMQKGAALCEASGLDPDSLVVLPFLE